MVALIVRLSLIIEMLSIKIKNMLKGIKVILVFVLVLVTVNIAFSNSESLVANEVYVKKFRNIAVAEMHRTGIPASIKLAQAILESGAGTSQLATKANNHFGIKCGGSWKGKTFHKKDDDRNKIGVKIKSCFRAYANPEESFKAHSAFLMNPSKKSRYGFLFDYKSTDYKSWAKGLKKAGYATNPKYPKLLMEVIEANKLHQYDSWKLSDIESDDKFSKPKKKETEKQNDSKEIEVITKADKTQKEHSRKDKKPSIDSKTPTSSTKQSKVFFSNDIRAISVKKGDTPKKLAKEHKIELSKLLNYNELEVNSKLTEGNFIYLQPKRKSYRGKKAYHVVYQESMHDIAQRYGIKLDELCKRNMMTARQEPQDGQRINLKTKRKSTPKLKRKIASSQKKPKKTLDSSIKNTKSKIVEVSKKTDKKIKTKYPKYIVKKGETLFGISKKHNISVENIQKWNNLKTNTLEIGQELIIQKR